MNAHKKIFFISSFLLSILFICLFSHSVFAQIEEKKTKGFDKKNETLLDKEAFGFVNTIIDQHWLIYDNSWFTISGALVQMKDVSYEVEIQEIKEVDRMNGIEWKGYFHIYSKFTRERNGGLGNGHNRGFRCKLCGDKHRAGHTTFKAPDSTWGKWKEGDELVGQFSAYQRIYRYAVNKIDGKWTVEVRIRCDGPSGWCIVGGFFGGSLKKPKIEDLPDFTGSGKLKGKQQHSTKQFKKNANKEYNNTKKREYAPYYKHIKDKISWYWLMQYDTDMSVNHVTSEDKPVIVTFKVLPSGKIINVKVADSTGNDLLASKIKKSIQNTKLNKFPDYIRDDYINVRFNFNLE